MQWLQIALIFFENGIFFHLQPTSGWEGVNWTMGKFRHIFLGLVGGVKPRKLIENGPGSMQCILCTCRTRKSKNYFLKIIFSMKFSWIDSSTSYYGPVSTMTTKFFENSKINFTIQQINQLNYNFLSMDLSTSAHAMTSLLSFWKHDADTMSALLSSPSSNHLPFQCTIVARWSRVHSQRRNNICEHCAYQHGGVAGVLADTQRAGFKGQRPFTTSNILCSP